MCDGLGSSFYACTIACLRVALALVERISVEAWVILNLLLDTYIYGVGRVAYTRRCNDSRDILPIGPATSSAYDRSLVNWSHNDDLCVAYWKGGVAVLLACH